MYMGMYCSLTKERLLAEHLTSLSKRGVGTLSSVSAFNHKRVPMSCFQRLDTFEYKQWTYNGATSSFEVKSLMAHMSP